MSRSIRLAQSLDSLWDKSTKRFVRFLTIAAFVALVAFSFVQGWRRSETDFPNYYTAAVLVRKGEKLRNYYDWAWFQRQMNYAGIERQLGGYIPQTPLTMLPMLPLAAFSVRTAKRIWLILNLGFLAAVLWMLARITRLSAAQIMLLVIAGYGSFHENFVLGQYYVFLLFLLTLAVYLLQRERPSGGGMLLGLAFGLKLYGGPFLLYFVAKRRWRAAMVMFSSMLFLCAVAVAMFGWSDIVYFATQILPRATEGQTLDPYNPANGTLSTLLRRTFVSEPELNPHPLWNAPWAFSFLSPLVTLAIVVFPLLALALRRSRTSKHDFAWFLIALLLASPNTASYTFALLLLPIALLLEDARLSERILIISCYVLLALPMRPSWNWLFPKVWLLLAIFLIAGFEYGRWFTWRPAMAASVLVILSSTFAAERSLASYNQEPGQRWERIAVERGAIYSSYPAVLRSGIVYASIGDHRYILRWLHGGHIDRFVFKGEAFHPVALSSEGPIRFELVAHKTTTFMSFNPTTRPIAVRATAAQSVLGDGDSVMSAVSPDGKWVAYTSPALGTRRIFLRKFGGGPTTPVTGGNCNSFAPVWELDSKAILFASDCGRGIGLPSLYRATLRKLDAAR